MYHLARYFVCPAFSMSLILSSFVLIEFLSEAMLSLPYYLYLKNFLIVVTQGLQCISLIRASVQVIYTTLLPVYSSCLFIFSEVSLEEQKFLISMKSL